jgi:hypothetical protein
MNKEPADKWYFRTSLLIIAFLSVGPLALPLVWINPRFSNRNKIIISIVVIILSYLLWVLLSSSLKSISTYYQTIFH